MGRWRWRRATYVAALLVGWAGVIWGFVGGNVNLWSDILFACGFCVALLVAPVNVGGQAHWRLRLLGVAVALAFLAYRVWLMLGHP